MHELASLHCEGLSISGWMFSEDMDDCKVSEVTVDTSLSWHQARRHMKTQ